MASKAFLYNDDFYMPDVLAPIYRRNYKSRMTKDQPAVPPESCQVTVIVPTLAEPARKAGVLRVIECILGQKDVGVRPLVVINGNRFDPALRSELEGRDDIDTFYREEGNLPKAQAFGVSQVQTPYYAFLDDDDLYTPDALAHRLSLMEEQDADLVVTNIEFDREGKRVRLAADIEKYSGDPLHSIFELAWLCSINGLFRKTSIGVTYFENSFQWMEWTSIAIEIAKTKRIVFSNKVTAIYFDTPNSASKTKHFTPAMVDLMAAQDKSQFPARTRRLIDQKYTSGLNTMSREALSEGDRAKAWKYHMACLSRPVGWRYFSYTRKLLLGQRSPSGPVG